MTIHCFHRLPKFQLVPFTNVSTMFQNQRLSKRIPLGICLLVLSQHWQAYHSTFHTQWVSELYRCIFPFSQQRTIAHRNKHQLSSCIYTQIFTGVLAAPAGTSRTARTSETSSHNLFLAVAYSNTEKQTQAVMVYILKCLLASLQHCVTAQTIHRHIIRCSGSLEYSYNTGKQTSAVVVY